MSDNPSTKFYTQNNATEEDEYTLRMACLDPWFPVKAGSLSVCPQVESGIVRNAVWGGGHTADRQSYSIGIYTPFPRAPFPRAPSPHLLVSPPHKFLLEEPQD